MNRVLLLRTGSSGWLLQNRTMNRRLQSYYCIRSSLISHRLSFNFRIKLPDFVYELTDCNANFPMAVQFINSLSVRLTCKLSLVVHQNQSTLLTVVTNGILTAPPHTHK